MKRILSLLILSIGLIVGLTACSTDKGGNEEGSNLEETQEAVSTEESENKPEKVEGNKLDEALKKKPEEESEAESPSSDSSKTESKPAQPQPSIPVKSEDSYVADVGIYLTDSQIMSLKRFSQSVQVKDQKIATAALSALKNAGTINGYSSPVPAGVYFTDISISNGIATVSYTNSGSSYGSAGETAFVGGVVYTLTEFPTIQGVKFNLQSGQSMLSNYSPDTVFTRGDFGGSMNIIN